MCLAAAINQAFQLTFSALAGGVGRRFVTRLLHTINKDLRLKGLRASEDHKAMESAVEADEADDGVRAVAAPTTSRGSGNKSGAGAGAGAGAAPAGHDSDGDSSDSDDSDADMGEEDGTSGKRTKVRVSVLWRCW